MMLLKLLSLALSSVGIGSTDGIVVRNFAIASG